jgi:hypothetical protein
MKALLSLFVAVTLSSIALGATSPIAITAGPITITNAGEYFLANDIIITNSDPVTAIDIVVSNVVLNLNGYVVRYMGPQTPFALRNGIYARYNSVVRNGRVRGWSNTGIIFANGSEIEIIPASGTIDNVGVSECQTGIAAAGVTVRRALVRDCPGRGFDVIGCELVSCVSRDNDTGFRSRGTNSFTRCKAFQNETGFELEGADVVDRCEARKNSGTGVLLAEGSLIVVSNSVVLRNGSVGIDVSSGVTDALIQKNRVIRNGFGDEPPFAAMIIEGASTRVEQNRFISNNPNTIVDTGTGTVLVDNVFRPPVP